MKTENRIYVADLGAYNNGRLIGKWFELGAMDNEELQAEIQKMLKYGEEWAIHDYELPFSAGEYDNIFKLNDFFLEYNSLFETEQIAVLALIQNGASYEEALADYNDCYVMEAEDMTDYAEKWAEEIGLLHDVPENLRYYFDFEAYGRDLETSGTFAEIEYNNTNYIVRLP